MKPLFAAALAIAVAALNYRFFEKPMTDLRERFEEKGNRAGPTEGPARSYA